MVELAVTLSIAAILFAIGVPSYRYVTNSNRVSSEVNSLLMDMQYARSEAIKEGRSVTVCPVKAGQCNATSSWESGWIVFMDPNANATVDNANEIVLRTQQAFGGTDTFTSDNAVQAITFNRDGFAAGLPATPITVTLHDSTSNTQWTRCLEIATIGIMSTEHAGTNNCT